jgi:hypothetical protein
MRKMKKVLMITFLLQSLYSISNGQVSYDNYEKLDNEVNNLGLIHNNVLNNVYLNFKIPENTTYEEGVDNIKNFNQGFLSSLISESDNTTKDSQFISSLFNDVKYFVNQTDFENTLLNTSGKYSLLNSINTLRSNNLVSENNLIILENLNNAISNNIRGLSTSLKLEQDLISIYNSAVESKDENGGLLIKQVIAIGLTSCQWWRNNPDAFNINNVKERSGPFSDLNESTILAQVVAMDIAGALVSSGAVALNNYINSGHVNWHAVGTGAVIGAVTSSTGLVGKVGRWISSIF